MQKGVKEFLKSQLKHFSRQKTPVRAIKRGGNYGKCFIRVEKRRRREIIVMKKIQKEICSAQMSHFPLLQKISFIKINIWGHQLSFQVIREGSRTLSVNNPLEIFPG